MIGYIQRTGNVPPTPSLRSLWRGAQEVCRVVAAAFEARRQAQELYGMDDRQLEKMGLSRRDIPAIVAHTLTARCR